MPPAGFKRSRALWADVFRPPNVGRSEKLRRLCRAVLYELQPIRFDTIDYNRISNQAKAWSAAVVTFCFVSIPAAVRWFLGTVLLGMTGRHWATIGAVVAYYYAVRTIHELLDAGPIVMILTALVAIFTIGLRDSEEGEISAYSVFNKGFQRILGTVDADALVAQHVGGGFAPLVAEPLAHEERRYQPREAAPAIERNPQEQNEENENPQRQQQQAGRSRKSGKKARRRDLEQRREVRRQREVAREMGLVDGGPDDEIAVQRLIEEQIAAENAMARNQ